jgi:hypothetical protein
MISCSVIALNVLLKIINFYVIEFSNTSTNYVKIEEDLFLCFYKCMWIFVLWKIFQSTFYYILLHNKMYSKKNCIIFICVIFNIIKMWTIMNCTISSPNLWHYDIKPLQISNVIKIITLWQVFIYMTITLKYLIFHVLILDFHYIKSYNLIFFEMHLTFVYMIL